MGHCVCEESVCMVKFKEGPKPNSWGPKKWLYVYQGYSHKKTTQIGTKVFLHIPKAQIYIASKFQLDS